MTHFGCSLRRCPGIHERFGDVHRLRVGQRLVQPMKRIGALTDGAPGHGRGVALEETERAKKMSGLAAPASPDLEMLAVDMVMRVDRARSGVRVMTGHDVAPTV